jgi:hypothetical protein
MIENKHFYGGKSIFNTEKRLNEDSQNLEGLELEEYLIYSYLKKKQKATVGQIKYLLNIHELLIIGYLQKLSNLGLIFNKNVFFIFRGFEE